MTEVCNCDVRSSGTRTYNHARIEGDKHHLVAGEVPKRACNLDNLHVRIKQSNMIGLFSENADIYRCVLTRLSKVEWLAWTERHLVKKLQCPTCARLCRVISFGPVKFVDHNQRDHYVNGL